MLRGSTSELSMISLKGIPGLKLNSCNKRIICRVRPEEEEDKNQADYFTRLFYKIIFQDYFSNIIFQDYFTRLNQEGEKFKPK